MEPPAWVMTDNGANLQKLSDQNSKLPDKAAQRVFDAGLEFASRGADEETQQLNKDALARAEIRFTLLIDELAPNYYGGYTNRANVRVAVGNYAGAVADYEAALRLAPLSKDVWITRLNLGNTQLAMGQADEALVNLQRSYELSRAPGARADQGKTDYTLLGRASAYHALGRYGEAAADYAAVVAKAPTDIQPFWLRYSLELFEVGQRQEALGVVRRLAGKFDIEPESNLAACSLLWQGGSELDRDEALRRWNLAPVVTRRSMVAIDTADKRWPPAAIKAAAAFRSSAPPVAPLPQEPQAAPSPEADAAAPSPAAAAAAAAATAAPSPAAPAAPAAAAAAAPSAGELAPSDVMPLGSSAAAETTAP